MKRNKAYFRCSTWFLFLFLFPIETVAQGPNIQDLLENIESAYAEVVDYQVNMEVNTYDKTQSFKTRTDPH